MRCPFCGFEESKVIDSRSNDHKDRIRRRRECLQCLKRFTTYETVEDFPIIVIKKDNSREVFDRSKIVKGILRACKKRDVTSQEIEDMVNEIESILRYDIKREVTSECIGNLIMDKLKQIDTIAYVRFASVYKDFDNAQVFVEEISKI